MFVDLYILAIMHLVGHAVFGHFEERTSVGRKLTKIIFLQGTTAVLFQFVGHWALVFVGGMFLIGIIFHLWWTLKNGIHPLTAEPRDKYYALRGWSL